MSASNYDLCPEGYMHIISSSGGPVIAPERRTSRGSRRALFLDAFAACSVSKSTNEAYAVALRYSPSERPSLYIAGNEAQVPQATQNHCTTVATALCEISQKFLEFHQSPKLDEARDAAADITQALHDRIITHTLAKIRKRVNKISDAKWQGHQEACAQALDDAQLSVYKNLVISVDTCRYFMKAQPENAKAIFISCKFLEIRSKDDARASALLIYLDKNPAIGGFSLSHYISKLLKIYHSVERLISVAASHTLRSLFEHMPALVFVTSEPRQIDFDLSNPPERIAEALEKLKIRTLRNVYSRYPHCECALLAYFLRLHIKDAYTTIGVSKSSCLGCRIYFRAFSVMILAGSLDYPSFSTLGAHNKMYPSYARPVLPADLAEVDRRIALLMKEELVQEILQRAWRQSPPQSDNSDIPGLQVATDAEWAYLMSQVRE